MQIKQPPLFNASKTHIRLAAPLMAESVVDGPGLRTVVWTQGCCHNCDGCHNPQTHSFRDGSLYALDELCDKIVELNQNITLSGGDPALQPEQCLVLAKCANENGLNVWMYTGFLFEDLLKSPIHRELFQYVDVLVDGKFDKTKKTSEAKFRGSSNQRLIDVKKSIINQNIVMWTDPMESINRVRADLF